MSHVSADLITSDLPQAESEPEHLRVMTSTCDLISHLGRASFRGKFLRASCDLMRAEQVTVLLIEGDKPTKALMSYRRLDKENMADRLCRTYASHFFERDELLRSHLNNLKQYTVRRVVARTLSDLPYSQNLFLNAGLAGKISFLREFGDEHIYLSFYYVSDKALETIEIDDHLREIGKLWTECVWRHHELTGGRIKSRSGRERMLGQIRDRFPDLSRREAQVCSGILCGFSLEATSLEHGFAISTAATFRKRAYAKLGITSQRELAAIFVNEI